ncbi:MAG: hypothetical protein WD069_16455 [Planctomycetales bacterium]
MVTNRVFPEQQAKQPQPVPAARGLPLAESPWKDQAGRWMHRLEDTLATRPQLAVGVAVAVGVLVGWLIKRR